MDKTNINWSYNARTFWCDGENHFCCLWSIFPKRWFNRGLKMRSVMKRLCSFIPCMPYKPWNTRTCNDHELVFCCFYKTLATLNGKQHTPKTVTNSKSVSCHRLTRSILIHNTLLSFFVTWIMVVLPSLLPPNIIMLLIYSTKSLLLEYIAACHYNHNNHTLLTRVCIFVFW